MEAREKGAHVAHVDPRFTRTSAVATQYVKIRPGTDVAFLGGLLHYIIANERWFDEYVKAYTNATTIVDDRFVDTEEGDGVFSGFDETKKKYDIASWQYDGISVVAAAGEKIDPYVHDAEDHPEGLPARDEAAAEQPFTRGRPPHEDPTMQDPRCIFQLLKKHYARYTPEMVERICGTPQAEFLHLAKTLCDNSGRERTSAFCYAVGWTHHSIAVQYIRAAAIVQMLLGNMGRPGGGILALRGHASIQGSTDIPTLFDLLPGYLPMPKVTQPDRKTYVDQVTSKGGFWGHADAYTVSLMKAWYGSNATAGNDFGFQYMPRLTGDHSTFPTMMGMIAGDVKGFIVTGENPAVGSANGSLNRRGLANLEWLVVRDFFEIETASFWYNSAEIETGTLKTEQIKTEIFFLPAADHLQKSGSFTNTQRLLQWHRKAIEPEGDCRSELSFYYHLGRRIREKLKNSTDPRDRAVLDLTWEYPTYGPLEDVDGDAVLAEINGYTVADRKMVSSYTELAADGSTACGCWIYAGVRKEGVNQADRRKPGNEQTWIAPEWGWAWPANRRQLYNRASADPEGKPWSERKKLVWWDTEKAEWTGYDVPDFVATKAPGYVPPAGAKAEQAHDGRSPFIMQSDGKAWLMAPSGIVDGPFPTHYEPHESPIRNLLHPSRRENPALERWKRVDNPSNPSAGEAGEGVYPYIMTTYRIVEHHTAGAMSRNVPHLAELQPEAFCEIGPALAAERGLSNGGWATIVSSRSAIEARVLVTERIADYVIDGKTQHVIGLPFHWGVSGIVTGDSANDLLSIAADPNVHIMDTKAATCDILPGRRPRGPALRELVNTYRRRATLEEEA